MFLVNSGIPMNPINKNIPKVKINAIFFLLIFEFLFNLFPLNSYVTKIACKINTLKASKLNFVTFL